MKWWQLHGWADGTPSPRLQEQYNIVVLRKDNIITLKANLDCTDLLYTIYVSSQPDMPVHDHDGATIQQSPQNSFQSSAKIVDFLADFSALLPRILREMKLAKAGAMEKILAWIKRLTSV